MDAAEVIYEGTAKDMSIRAMHDDAPGFERSFVDRHITLQRELYYIDPAKGLRRLTSPTRQASRCSISILSWIADAWAIGGKQYARLLLLTKFEDFMQEIARLLWHSNRRQRQRCCFGFTQDYVFIHVLEDVKPRIYVVQQTDGGWTKEPLIGAPSFDRSDSLSMQMPRTITS
jgi:prolyl oligopeptidase